MIPKINVYDDGLAWQTHAYHLTARQKKLTITNQALNGLVYLVEISVGGRILPHSQPQIELLFCIEGTGTLSLSKFDTQLKRGDMLQLPAEVVRGIVNEGQQALRLLVIRTEIQEPEVELKEWLRRWWGGF